MKSETTTILALVFLLIATPCFAKCKVGADVTPGDDSVWIVSCRSTPNGDWMLDSNGKVYSDDTKAIKKAMKAARDKSVFNWQNGIPFDGVMCDGELAKEGKCPKQ